MNKQTEKIFVLLSDFFAINLAWILFYQFRVETGWFKLLIQPEFLIPMFAVYIYWFVIFIFVGMYRRWFAASRFDEMSTLFKATFVGIFLLFFLIFFDDATQNVPDANRFLIFYYWGLFLVLVSSGRLIVRYVQRKLLIKGFGRRNALIVGFNPIANDLHDNINYYRALGLDIKGYLAVYEENIGKEYKGIKVIDTYHNVDRVIDQTNAKEIIIALEKSSITGYSVGIFSKYFFLIE